MIASRLSSGSRKCGEAKQDVDLSTSTPASQDLSSSNYTKQPSSSLQTIAITNSPVSV